MGVIATMHQSSLINDNYILFDWCNIAVPLIGIRFQTKLGGHLIGHFLLLHALAWILGREDITGL
jgi:hypothetical protein